MQSLHDHNANLMPYSEYNKYIIYSEKSPYLKAWLYRTKPLIIALLVELVYDNGKNGMKRLIRSNGIV
ncbi:MAG: hypothetical protein VR66_22030 [Peptococcaceae bacterium BRH_c23]|nr:MAG: hypothetical protein VR66_22030 [Peptococcaceae bacterium BRH_c23]KJS82191.1 MAG: hypothetical protein JL57_24885 [Desulfosporosinus sp. BICA1-9]HBW39007.1 hypothetical protein [Desulfosporosinus sp.]